MTMPPCPHCKETQWTQQCNSATAYDVIEDGGGGWTFGPIEVIEDTETLYYNCLACGKEADSETREAIEDALP